MTATQKVRLTNTFHNGSVNVVGEVVDHDAERGVTRVRVSHGQKMRAERSLCGIKECRCERHGPYFEPTGNPWATGGTTWLVAGKVV